MSPVQPAAAAPVGGWRRPRGAQWVAMSPWPPANPPEGGVPRGGWGPPAVPPAPGPWGPPEGSREPGHGAPGWGAGSGGPPPGGGKRRNRLPLVIALAIAVPVLAGGILGLVVGLRTLAPAATTPPDVESAPPAASPSAAAIATDPTASLTAAPTATATATPTAPATPELPAERSVFDLQVGDCYDEPDTTEGLLSVALVPCSGPHESEVFAVLTYPADEGEAYPGAEVVEAYGSEQCMGEAYAEYVGQEYDLSSLFAATLLPSEESWTRAGDREVVCVVYDHDGPLVGSPEGSGL